MKNENNTFNKQKQQLIEVIQLNDPEENNNLIDDSKTANLRDEIEHYNKWLTDKIIIYIKNLNKDISNLFRPYKSFTKLSSLFGLNENYLREQRFSYNAKHIIPTNLIDKMRLSFCQKIKEWIAIYPQYTSLLIKVESNMIGFLNDYKERFKALPSSKYQMYRYHPKFIRDYFSEIKTKTQAYWLGFLFADGFITLEHKKSRDYYRMGIALSEIDKDHLIKFCNEIGLNLKYLNPEMVSCSFTTEKTPFFRIRWGDQEMAKNLINHGMGYIYNYEKGKRVKIIRVPKLENRDLMLAFLLGFYDGDGCLSLRKLEGDRISILPTIISADRDFLNQIKEYFRLDYEIFTKIEEKFDFKRNIFIKTEGHRLYLGTSLFIEMLKNYENSLGRKRLPLEMLDKYGISAQRHWLTNTLSKDDLLQILELISSHLIGKTLGLDGRTIISFARDVYGIEFKSHGHYSTIRNSLRWNGNNSKYYNHFVYWLNYLKDLGKFEK